MGGQPGACDKAGLSDDHSVSPLVPGGLLAWTQPGLVTHATWEAFEPQSLVLLLLDTFYLGHQSFPPFTDRCISPQTSVLSSHAWPLRSNTNALSPKWQPHCGASWLHWLRQRPE
jgi:hypothetical protein